MATTWLQRRYAIRIIDDELERLRDIKLDTSPADPRRPGLIRRIDWLLDERNRHKRGGDDGAQQ